MRKYIKGKDGKFKGSLPNTARLPKALTSDSLPKLPKTPAKPLESNISKLNTAPEGITSKHHQDERPLPIPATKEEKQVSFYASTGDHEFLVPESVAAKLERGDMAYFQDEHLLYTDSYGDHNASHYPAFPQDEASLIDLTSVRNGAVADNINAATSYAELDEEVKTYFTDGGCAALAVEIHDRVPGSKLGIIIAAMTDDPNDATAAHVYVSKDGEILDGFGATGLADYDYQNAAGVDPDFMEVYAYDATPETVHALIKHGCFGNNFNEASKGLIGKAAELVIGEQDSQS
jgi:hypothetical protein